MVSSGTSHSTPFATGVAALLVCRARRFGKNLSSSDVKRIFRNSAVALNGGFNNETGYGLLNAASALQALDREMDQDRPP